MWTSLALAFSKNKVVGFDIDFHRINQLNKGIDSTMETNSDQLKKSLNSNLYVTNNKLDLIDCNIYIVTVPTPITDDKNPDLKVLFLQQN